MSVLPVCTQSVYVANVRKVDVEIRVKRDDSKSQAAMGGIGEEYNVKIKSSSLL